MFVLWFLLLSSIVYLLFFLAYSQPSQIGWLPYFCTWCGLSANLGCRSETCCKRIAEIQDAKSRQKFAICAPSHKFVYLYLRNWGTYRQSEKKLLNSIISSTCSRNMVNFGPLAAEIGSLVWGTPANFNGFRVLASLLQRRRSTEANWTLQMFGRLLSWYTIHTFLGLLPRYGIFPGAIFTLRPSFTLFYVGSVTARHWSSGRQSNFAALSRERHLYSAGRPSRWALVHI